MLKAIMFLYIGVCFIWILGVSKTKYWKQATALNVLFMLTLALGRTLSMVVDGLPTTGYVFGVIAEFFLAMYALYQLRKYKVEA